MNKNNLPVLLITWNRPNHLSKSYKSIINAGVSEIFIYNDGLTLDMEINKKIMNTRELIKIFVNKNKSISHKIFF